MRDNMHRHTRRHWRGSRQGPGQWGQHHAFHGRGRRGGRGHGGDWQDFFGGDRGSWFWEGHFGGHGGHRGGRERMERGLLRYVILSVLKDGPRHGYEIIKQLEERTQGRYSPSPGTLYPTLQLLEDQGLVKADQEADRRVYHLTDSGNAELDKQNNLVEGFWSRFQDHTPSGATLHEMRFARDAMRDLLRTAGGALRSSAYSGDIESVRKVRQALEQCQNEVREIITQSAGAEQTANTGESEDIYL